MIMRESNGRGSESNIEQQAILHDLSTFFVNVKYLEQLTRQTLPREGGKAAWAADGGFEHLPIWHLYRNSRMLDLDYPW